MRLSTAASCRRTGSDHLQPVLPVPLAHVVDAAYITTGFVVVGVAASLSPAGRFVAEARTMLSMTLWLLTVLVPLQFLLGDAHGLNTLENQPAKLAAIEAIWDTEPSPWTCSPFPTTPRRRTITR